MQRVRSSWIGLGLGLGLGLTLGLVTVASAQPAPPAPPAPEPPSAPAPDAAPDPAPAPGPAPHPGPESAPAPAAAEPTPAAPDPWGGPPPAGASSDRAEPTLRAYYDKGVVLATDDEQFQLRLALRTQFRLELIRPTEDGAELSARLSIPRARLQLEGHVLGKAQRYKLELALGDRGSFGFVRDLYVERRVAAATWVRVGQWKRPFNRQELVADFGSEFNERAITAEFVGGGRDLGLAVHNDYEKSPAGLEWVVGLFNSFAGGADRPSAPITCRDDAAAMTVTCTQPAPTTVPTDFAPALVARVGFNRGEVKGYTEADLEGGPLRWGVGLNYKVDLADLSAGNEASVADNLSHAVGADAMVKARGLGAEVGLFLVKRKSGDAQLGAMGQVGAFLRPRRLQLAGRLAVAPPTGTAGGERRQVEARAALNLYARGHSLKLASDVGALWLTGRDGAGERDDPELQARSMVQLTF